MLPSGYAGDSVAMQELIITDEERGDRGLSEFPGLDPALDAAALKGALADADPSLPPGYLETSAGAIFAQDYTPLGADYAWMYDDGYGGTNRDCTSPGAGGCWGHRDNILGDWTTTGSQTAMMGDAGTSEGQYTEIFANQVDPADPLVAGSSPGTLPTPATAAPPDVVQVLPASSPGTEAGTPVTIEGNYFGASSQVSFGGVPATDVHVNWDGELVADAPADPAGTATDQVVVTVTTGAGSSAATGTPAVNEFTYAPTSAPTVTSVSPTSGAQIPSGSVVIHGANFYDGGVTPIVDFGTVASIGSISYSATEITTTIPPSLNPATVNVTVTTPAGTSVVSPADRYTYTSSGAPPAPPPAPTPPPPSAAPPPSHGYWLVGSDGGIFTFGSAQFYGSTGSLHLQRPVVGITPTADRGGYWLVASDGGIFAFGDAGFHGSIPGTGLNPAGSGQPHSLDAPIVGMVPSSDGGGYFMVASDGGVFAFGDAKFEGSCPGIGGCSGAAVAVVPDASGDGYWVMTSTGSVYTFGDAADYGQPGPQSSAITSAVATPNGGGYWILDGAGQVFAFGTAAGMGSLAPGSAGGFDPASAVFDTSDGGGYWVVTALGQGGELRRCARRRRHGRRPPQRADHRRLRVLSLVASHPGHGRRRRGARGARGSVRDDARELRRIYGWGLGSHPREEIMGIFQRAHDIVQAKTNKALDAAEKPDEMLDLSYEKMLEQITQVRRALVDIAGSKKRLQLQEEQFQHTIDHLQDQAKQALAANREDLAKEALARKAAAQQQIDQMQPQVQQLDDEEQKLTQTLDVLQKRVNDFRTQKETLKAQYTAAKAISSVDESTAGISKSVQRLWCDAPAGTGQDRHHAGPLGRARRAARVRCPRGRRGRHRRHPEGARPGRQGRAGRQRTGGAQGAAGDRRTRSPRPWRPHPTRPPRSRRRPRDQAGVVSSMSRATTSASSSPRSSWRKWPAPATVWCGRPAGAGHVRSEHLGPAAGARVAVGEGGEERALEAGQGVERAPVEAGAFAGRGEAHEEGQLARTGAERLVGERGVVGRQHRVWDRRRGGPLHEEAGAERRELLGEPLVVEQGLRHGDRAVGRRRGRPRPAVRPGRRRRCAAPCWRRRPGGPARAAAARTPSPMGPPQSWTTRVMRASPSASTNWAIQSMWARTVCAVRSSGLSERPNPTRSGATARRPRATRRATTAAVEVAPGRLAVQQQSGVGARGTLVDVVHAQPVGEDDVVRREGKPGQVGEARSRESAPSARRSSCPTWHGGPRA